MARTRSINYADKRQDILDKAAELFAARGFHAASISDIAKSCNTSKSALYHYYASKEAILFAVMEDHTKQLAEIAEDIALGKGQPGSKLQKLSRAFMALYVKAAARHKVLLNDLDALPAAQKKHVVRLERQIIGNVQKILEDINPDAFAGGHLRHAVSMIFMGAINWTHIWFDPEGPLTADEFADLVAGMMSASVMALKPRGESL